MSIIHCELPDELQTPQHVFYPRLPLSPALVGRWMVVAATPHFVREAGGPLDAFAVRIILDNFGSGYSVRVMRPLAFQVRTLVSACEVAARSGVSSLVPRRPRALSDEGCSGRMHHRR